jgi:outer membrane receptor protein involved in Fe transport
MDVSNEQTFNPLTGESNNGGESRRQGLELGWRAPVTGAVVLSGDWTFLDARYRHLVAVPEEEGGEGDATPVVLDGQRVYNTAKYVGTAALELAPAGRWWSARVGANWVGPYSPFDEPGVVLGGYGLLHVGATAHVRQLALDAGVRNLLDREYPELVAGGLVSPGQPRAAYLTVRYLF